ncbi:Protein Star [Orchesella cincta]|uniref:Protein Star n=1 Tax=Orchesella cincta TaxID=48709 RepID=A0A1D2MPW4_ORCCI|nr:Protein Star [Orchesella cincta]
MRYPLTMIRHSNFWFVVSCVFAAVLFFNAVYRLPIEYVMSGEPVILPQNDQRIIQYILSKKLLQPPSEKPYNLEMPDEDPSRGQGQLIRKILNNMTKGFFVECGGLDGETRSNTLFMEMHLGWKGLLVEADPNNYMQLLTKNRKSWSSNTCLSIKPHPHQANFIQDFNQGKILEGNPDGSESVVPVFTDRELMRGGPQDMAPYQTVVKVQCMPLFSLLAAMNVSVVDYFSLDVEGNELQVLKTIPFDKILIKTLSVEFIHTEEGKELLLEFMLSKGYGLAGEVTFVNNLANDLIFVHPSVAKGWSQRL